MTEDREDRPETEQPDETKQPAEQPEAGREEELRAEVDRLKDQLLRALAETENVRRRLEQQAEDRGRYAIANFAKDMLTVADNLRRAIESVPDSARETNDVVNSLTVGVEMTERELKAALERYGVKQVPAMGQPFDPHFHQAVMEVEDPGKPAGTVVMVMQEGYMIQERLLRPAMVGVSKGGPKREPGEPPPGEPEQGQPRVDTRV